jgi:hypothetical protein
MPVNVYTAGALTDVPSGSLNFTVSPSTPLTVNPNVAVLIQLNPTLYTASGAFLQSLEIIATTSTAVTQTVFYQFFSTPVTTYKLGGSSAVIKNTTASAFTVTISGTVSLTSGTLSITSFNYHAFFF